MSEQTLTIEDGAEGAAAPQAVGAALCRVLCWSDLRARPRWIVLPQALEVSRGAEDASTPDRFHLDDGRVSRPHGSVRKEGGGLLVTDLGSKNGTWVNGKRVQSARIKEGDILEIGSSLFVLRTGLDGATLAALSTLPTTLQAPGLPPLVTASPRFAAVLSTLARAAPSMTPLLLLGPTGTGKEVLARRIHALSLRSGPLVAVNCGALPATLVEAELFGAKKGAYTGAAADRKGLVKSAEGGTLFLDEIGDLPLSAQAALLRVLQEREVTPVGSSTPVRVDFRVVAATHHDLAADVQRGAFREDLLARLSGVTLNLPPLSARLEDVGLLLSSFLGAEPSVRLTPAAARLVLSSPWPRNVRALERAFEAALALCAADEHGVRVIDVEHLAAHATAGAANAGEAERDESDDDSGADEDDGTADAPPALQQELVALLKEHKGNVSAVARVLGKKRMQVYRYIDRYHLDPGSFR